MLRDADVAAAWHALTADGRPWAPALHVDERSITYGELAGLVHDRLAELELADRSVVVLHGVTGLEHVVTYLALLAGGHVPLLAGERHAALAERWTPAAVVEASATGVCIEHHDGPQHRLHPDLALLLSTSGSTGSPKLVRLSHRNLVANARSIVDMLALRDTDRGITSLPLHYCYGLSVLHSHLLAGASVVLTAASVVDPCFEAAMARHGVTNLAGVPHTYELMERAGPERLAVPSLRLLTQAGGRMAPADVLRWADRAASWGAELVVMYGQTEATARIAYLPPSSLHRHPDCIGVAVPGTSVEVRPVDDRTDGVGELVVRGEHVMMGYAEQPADLARGPEVLELHTGDLARMHDDGVLQIVGRRSRFVKPLGLRIDLDHLQSELGRRLADRHPAVAVAVTGDDQRLAVAVVDAPATATSEVAVSLTGLPAARIAVAEVDALPRTEAGKLDFDAVTRAVQAAADGGSAHDGLERNVADVYRTVLGVREVSPDDTFVGLGGDSLSYVECSIRLEPVLGRLPNDWHVTPIAALQPAPRRRLLPRIDTTVVLRAVAICMVVSTHMGLVHVPGGAHTLLAVVGYNLARFMGSIANDRRRLAAGVRTARRVAVPTIAWVAAGMTLFGAYSAGTLLLVNNYVGPESHADDHWHFWFMEVFVHLVLFTTLLLAVPAVRRIERRWPYRVALGLFAVSLIGRMDWTVIGDAYNQRFRTHSVAFFFFAGWLVAQSDTTRRRLGTTVLCLAVLPGFFGYSTRDWLIAVALTVLLWLPELPVPRVLATPINLLATSSMWILITHFTVWPFATQHLPLPQAYLATLAAGVVVATVVGRLPAAAQRFRRSRTFTPHHTGATPCTSTAGA